ncbi:hypothetical protein [Medusavirus stheno T3]|uniref:F-box domain-containing protein n=1 Tax=Medusavirus stheno T3 TaxID=3069717 RepID=A0A7S8BET1_9VIRU|nr:hypothetical protein QKU73_gp307 [Acanthamoeba castellanii medusavirus]QPB44468.1 hypothetical protein [Medusavirus stheno T3]
MQHIPLETLAHIMGLLGLGDAARLAATCRNALAVWRDESSSRRRWAGIFAPYAHAIDTSTGAHATHREAFYHLGRSIAHRDKIESRLEERDALAYHAPIPAMLDMIDDGPTVWVVYAPASHRRQAPWRAREIALALYGRVDAIGYGHAYPASYHVSDEREFLGHCKSRVAFGVNICVYPDDSRWRKPSWAAVVVVDGIHEWLLKLNVRGVVNLSCERMKLWREASPATKLHFRRHHLLNTALTDNDRHHFGLLVSFHKGDPYALSRRTGALSYALINSDPWTQTIIARVREFVPHHHAPCAVVKHNRRRSDNRVWRTLVKPPNDVCTATGDHYFFFFR